MEYEWDEAKNTHNKRKHKIGFEEVQKFAWDTSKLIDRTRPTDGERRFAAVGWLGDKLFTVIYARRKDRVRGISMRRSNKTEEVFYEQEK